MKITKKYKLYFRSQQDGSLKRLDKVSLFLYVSIIKGFFNKGLFEEYKTKNKNIKHWSQYKPIDLIVPSDHLNEFRKLTNKNQIVISFSGSWQPLVKLTLKNDVIKKDSELKNWTFAALLATFFFIVIAICVKGTNEILILIN